MSGIETSRRAFLKVGALAGATALGAATLGACSPKSETAGSGGTGGTGTAGGGANRPVDVQWSGYFDVIVVGFGAAGASAALSAADSGAKVLLIDKAPEGHEGGNSRYCAQLFISVNDYQAGLEHYKALRGEFYTPDSVLEAYVDGMANIKKTLIDWGADESQMWDFTDLKVSNLGVEYPELPGATALRTNFIDHTIMAAALWRFLKKNVVSRKDKIDCWYESPATALIQDPDTKMIVGVEIEHEGKKVNIAAKNGVVLSLGGYENNPLLTQQYTGYTTIYPIGTLYNEGDGFRMAQEAGAKLWHMGAWESNGTSLIHPTDRVRNTGTKAFFAMGSTILVGQNGYRYIAEDLEQRHGHVLIGGSWIMPKRPERNFFVFDEAQRLAMGVPNPNPLDFSVISRPFANWSTDLAPEIEQGKIIKADTLEALATKMGIDSAGLQTTVSLFNQSATSGLDAFGRLAKNMTAFGSGPYYGIEVFPSILNSQGGPERTAKGEIVDTSDKPLPHLYSAGEFGGVTAHLYQGGGNMAECIIFGKISGANAASEKSDAFTVSETNLPLGPGSGAVSIYDQTPDAAGLAAGEAVGVGEGLGGPIWVKIKTTGGKVTSVEVLHHSETEGVGDKAIRELPATIAAAGGIEVDTVSGATLSTAGLKGAVANALSQVK